MTATAPMTASFHGGPFDMASPCWAALQIGR
jgi:hypothetical protein